MQGDRKKNVKQVRTPTTVLKLTMIPYASILHTYTHAYSIYVYVGKEK